MAWRLDSRAPLQEDSIGAEIPWCSEIDMTETARCARSFGRDFTQRGKELSTFTRFKPVESFFPRRQCFPHIVRS